MSTEQEPPPEPYLLSGGAALGQRDASVEQPRVSALVLGEGLSHRPAALEHLHLLVLLQGDLQPLLGPQHLLLQRQLQFLLGAGGGVIKDTSYYLVKLLSTLPPRPHSQDRLCEMCVMSLFMGYVGL